MCAELYPGLSEAGNDSECVSSAFQLVPACSALAARHLNLHEYQSKLLMTEHGVNVQKFTVAENTSAAQDAAWDLGTNMKWSIYTVITDNVLTI